MLLIFIAISVIITFSAMEVATTIVSQINFMGSPAEKLFIDLVPPLVGVLSFLTTIALILMLLSNDNIIGPILENRKVKKQSKYLKKNPDVIHTAKFALKVLQDIKYYEQYPNLTKAVLQISEEFDDCNFKKLDLLVSEYDHEINLIASMQKLELSLPEKEQYLTEMENVIVTNKDREKSELKEQTLDVTFDTYKKLNNRA